MCPASIITILYEQKAYATAPTLLPLLKAMGVEFDQLGHISSTMDLKVDEAVQQVRLIVGETGTVAAALTEVEAVELAAPVPDET